MKVRDWMTREVASVRRNDKLLIADDVMRLGRIRHSPVLDDHSDDLVGILSQRDLFRGALASALGYGEHAQQKLIGMPTPQRRRPLLSPAAGSPAQLVIVIEPALGQKPACAY